ncbi:MAG: multidrug transporter [Treponema sp.]|jgi:hypothetical protein|nr:multidrug transporter [Treponema sp.]
MMDIFLQLWGGLGYLLAKALLAHAEGLREDRSWRIAGWSAYLIGLPAWVVLLAGKQNWIAAAIEAGGAPALLLGLVSAWKRSAHTHKAADWLVKACTGLMIAGGIAYSVYRFRGITALSQGLEIGVTVGFLSGSYLLAKKNPFGWLLFAEMLIAMGVLMYIQDKRLLVFQQGISLVFVINGFIRARSKKIPDAQ